MYNLMQDAFTLSTSSGISGYTIQSLSLTQQQNLCNLEASVSVPNNKLIGIESTFVSDFVFNEAHLYAPQNTGVVRFVYTNYSHDNIEMHGSYNTSTTYATPKMTSNNTPAPIVVTATSQLSGYEAYKALTQTNINSFDCWSTAANALPVSYAVYFGSYGKVINKYRIQGRAWAFGGNPSAWRFEGSTMSNPSLTNDSHWTTLHTASIGQLSGSAWSSWFTFNNLTPYKWYRMYITADLGFYAETTMANLQMVEGFTHRIIPVIEQTAVDMTWDGDHYVYSPPEPIGITGAKFFYANNTGSSLTVSGVAVLADETNITTSGGGTTSKLFSFNSYNQNTKTITLTNDQFNGRLDARVNLQYTGNYDIDRNISLCPDPVAGVWHGLDNGSTWPEAIPWNRGSLTNISEYSRELVLDAGQTSGEWLSPVIEFDEEPAGLYLYGNGDFSVEVRASDSPPPTSTFTIVTTEPSHRYMMQDHKKVYFDSTGRTIGSTSCTDTGGDYKIWREAQPSWANKRLRYYPSINDRGTAAFLVPGAAACSDMDPIQEMADQSNWFNLCTCKMDDNSSWDVGTTVSGWDYGRYHTVALTKTFPVEASDAFVVFSVVSRYYPYSAPRVFVNLALQDGEETRFSSQVITVEGTYLHGDDSYDVIADKSNNAWWVYLGGKIGKIYKVDLGSLNTVKFFVVRKKYDAAGEVSYEGDTVFQGYTHQYDIDNSYTRLIEIPRLDFTGFWAIKETSIDLYQEGFDYGSKLQKIASIDTGIESTSFGSIWTGTCDSYGNLWFVDLTNERLFRINLNAAVTGEGQVVDYENNIDGILDVHPHPTNGTCYVLVSNGIDTTSIDAIKMVHWGQEIGSQPKLICFAPGFYSAQYQKGVSFVGHSSSSYIMPHSGDTFWGTSGSITWYDYKPNTGNSLPRGRYKQFKITLSREQSSLSSPRLQKLRIPSFIKISRMDTYETKEIKVKTTLHKSTSPGTYQGKLLLWWPNEEYIDG